MARISAWANQWRFRISAIYTTFVSIDQILCNDFMLNQTHSDQPTYSIQNL